MASMGIRSAPGLLSANEHDTTITSSDMLEWHLTGPHGMNATAMALNGKLLVAKVVAGGTEYDLPSLDGRPSVLQPQQHAPPVVEMSPASIAFVQLTTPTGVCSTSSP